MTPPSNKSVFAKVWDALKAFQHQVAVALTIAVLFVLYFTVFAVVALLARLLGKDLLQQDKPEPGTHWLRRAPEDKDLQTFFRQF